MTLRGAASSRAAVSALKRLSEVESPAITEPLGAPGATGSLADADREVGDGGHGGRAVSGLAVARRRPCACPFLHWRRQHGRAVCRGLDRDDALRRRMPTRGLRPGGAAEPTQRRPTPRRGGRVTPGEADPPRPAAARGKRPALAAAQ